MWILGIVVLLLLLIPLTAIILDSEVGRALARRLGSDVSASPDPERLERVEDEVRYLSETVQSLQEETRFIRALLEEPREGSEPRESLPPGEA